MSSDLLTVGELTCVSGSRQLHVEGCLKGEMCWVQQVGDGVLGDTSAPRLWKERSTALDGPVVREVASREKQGDQASVLRLGRN
jgi:hypothetical protein